MAPISFAPDIDIWHLTIQDFDTEAIIAAKKAFLRLYANGASAKEAAYKSGKGVPYRQVLIWLHLDPFFAAEMQRITDERRAHPDLAKAIFLDHLAVSHNPYAAAEAAGLDLDDFKAFRREDPAFKRGWKRALKMAVALVEQNTFYQAQTGSNPMWAFPVLNSHLKDTYRPDPADAKLGAGDITVVVNVAIDPARQPKRLPPQAGNEISLPSGGGEEEQHDDD